MKITSEQCDGRYLIRKAEKSGLIVTNGKGDHVKIEAPCGRGYMIVPDREIGRGLACTIVKWLMAAGVSFVLMFAAWVWWVA